MIPVVHMSGPGVGGEIADSSGGYFFIWTLIALGETGTFSMILSARGVWRLCRGRSATLRGDGDFLGSESKAVRSN
jgi:hypothetical protein